MTDDKASVQADSVLQAERASRPRWRNSATKHAPAWFRGEELDLVEPAERRQVYEAAAARMGPIPWPQFLALGVFACMLLGQGHAAWRWTTLLAVAAWIAGVSVSTALRRRTIREQGRTALRESADWPQRLDKLRS